MIRNLGTTKVLKVFFVSGLVLTTVIAPLGDIRAQDRDQRANRSAQIKVIGKPSAACPAGRTCPEEAEAKRIRAALALMYLGIRRDCGAGTCAIKLTKRQR